MKSRVLKNTEALIRFFYPVIVDWAQLYDYSIPSVTVLMKYKIEFRFVESWKSKYNGSDTDAIGSHNASAATILVAAERHHSSVMSTLIHELAHAVQYFSMGDTFHTNYSMEAKVKQHAENVFENQARDLSDKLRIARYKIPGFDRIFQEFKFKFVPTKHPNIKKPKPPTPKGSNRRMRYQKYFDECGHGMSTIRFFYEESHHYSDTKFFKCNRNSWWLRR